MYLLDNRLAPLTYNWGFIEAPIDGGPGFITHSHPWFLPRGPTLTLAEARKQPGLTP